MDLRELRDTWNELGRKDAMWAVLTGPQEASREWDRESFFQTGVDEVAAVLGRADSLGASPRKQRALDFGCGIGRLSQALAAHFASVDGVDIAAAMLEQARAENRVGDRIRFHLNESDSLALFEDGTFDFVYSSITLQHMEPRYSRRFLEEFFRVTVPGGVVVFQIPSEPVASQSARASRTGPLPPNAFRAEIEAPSEIRCAPGARMTLPVHVRNISPFAWPALGDESGGQSVRLGNHWRHRFGWMVRHDDVRAALAEDLGPGEERVMDFVVEAPSSGSHVLELDMVQENVSWFAKSGSRTARVRVNVDPSLAPGTAIGIPRRMGMYGIAKPEVERIISSAGAKLLAADEDDAPGPGWTSYRYFARR